jgi:hypothetical protein
MTSQSETHKQERLILDQIIMLRRDEVFNLDHSLILSDDGRDIQRARNGFSDNAEDTSLFLIEISSVAPWFVFELVLRLLLQTK